MTGTRADDVTCSVATASEFEQVGEAEVREDHVVELDDPAPHLYERVGFITVAEAHDATTMFAATMFATTTV